MSADEDIERIWKHQNMKTYGVPLTLNGSSSQPNIHERSLRKGYNLMSELEMTEQGRHKKTGKQVKSLTVKAGVR